VEKKFEKLTVIDLMSEQHTVLRKITEDRWREVSDISFSHTDFFLLSKLEQESISISQAASFIKISRQAMQKSAVSLEERGYIRFEYLPGNLRDKYMTLTEEGKICQSKYNRIKEKLEREMAENIGREAMAYLKSILKKKLI